MKYFMFSDILAMPTQRGLQAMDIYEELAMRCTRDFLIKHCEAIEAILNNPKKLELTKLAILSKNLRERLELLPMPDHVFRLASVVFFDETENPYHYDRAYNQKKVERWKQNPDMLGFFLSTPLRDLIPFLGLEQINLHTYSAVCHQLNEYHLKEVLSALSEKNTKVVM